MIDITPWTVTAKLIFLLTPFILIGTALILTTYTTITREYDVACAAITSNPYLEVIKRAWSDGGFKWRWLVICTISGYVGFPWLVSITGKLDLDELNVFPTGLKRRLAIAFWLNAVGFCWLLLGWAFFEYNYT